MIKMTQLIAREWNEKTIRQREDGYISATDMCSSVGKYFADWQRLKSTDAYLQALERSVGFPTDQLIQIVNDGSNDERGTWVHRKVAIRLAQWLSPELAVQVDSWVEQLMTTGKVELTEHPEQELDDIAVIRQMLNTMEKQRAELKILQYAQIRSYKRTINFCREKIN